MKSLYQSAGLLLAIAGPILTAAQRGGGGGGFNGGFSNEGPRLGSSTTTSAGSSSVASVTATDSTTLVSTGSTASLSASSISITGSSTDTSSSLSGTAGSSSSITTSASSSSSGIATSPTTTGSTQPTTGSGSDLTISLVNKHTFALSLSFGANSPGPTPLGNPQPTGLAQAASTSYIYPSGWAGRIYVGKANQVNNSLIEASLTGAPDIDVSYVDGYSVPITCGTSASTAVTGCNVDLFAQSGKSCPPEDLDTTASVCGNPSRNLADGPAAPFFAACAGAAYTYPNDNGANVGNLAATTIFCCVGMGCPAPGSQKGKRGFGEEAVGRAHSRSLHGAHRISHKHL